MKIQHQLLYLLLYLCSLSHIAAQDQLNFSITHASAADLQDGSIELSIIDQEGPFHIFWEKDNSFTVFEAHNQPANTSINSLSPGNYCVTVTTSTGCQAGDCVEVLDCEATNSCLTANFSYEYGYDGCNIQFTSESTGNIVNWTWYFDDGASISNDPNPFHFYETSRCYDVVLEVVDANGNTNSIIKTVCAICGENEEPTCVISAPSVALAGQSIQLSAITGGGLPPYTYDWSLPLSAGFGIENDESATFTFDDDNFGFSNGQTYNFYLDITDATGVTGSCLHTVEIAGAVPDVDLVVFQGDGGYTYFVSFADVFNFAGFEYYTFTVYLNPNCDDNPVDDVFVFTESNLPVGQLGYTFEQEGCYIVYLTVTDDVGVYQDSESFIIGNPTIPPPQPPVNMTPNGESMGVGVCDGCTLPITLAQGNFNFNAFATTYYDVFWFYRSSGSSSWQPANRAFIEINDGTVEFGGSGLYFCAQGEVGDCFDVRAAICPQGTSCSNLKFNQPVSNNHAIWNDFQVVATEECKINIIPSLVEIEDITLFNEGENGCQPYLKANAFCGFPEPYTINYGPCQGEQVDYLYFWKAYDKDNPDLEIPNLLYADESIGTGFSPCTYVDLNHPYFDQFAPNEDWVFRVKAMVEDNMGAGDEEEALITLAPPLSINVAETLQRCGGYVTAFHQQPIVSGGSGNYQFDWSMSPNIGDIGSANSLFPTMNLTNLTTDGTVRSYYLKVTDNITQCTVEQSIQVTISSLTLDLGNSVSACSGNSLIELGPEDLNLGGSGEYTFRWRAAITSSGESFTTEYLSDANIANPLVQPVNPPGNGSQVTYTLTVQDVHNGCEVEDFVYISPGTINPIANAGEDKTICNGVDMILGTSQSGSGLSNPQFSWTSNAPGFSEQNTQLLFLDENVTKNAGTYTYTLTVQDATYGCMASDEVNLTTLKPWSYEGFNANIKAPHHPFPSNLKAWDTNNNFIYTSENSNSGAVPPFQYSWLPNAPSPNVTSWFDGYPNQATFDPTKHSSYTLKIRDAQGCEQQFPTNKYYLFEKSPTISISTTAPTELECQAGFDNCLSIEIDLHYAGGETLPDRLRVDGKLYNPLSNLTESLGMIWLSVVDRETGIYAGKICLEVEQGHDSRPFKFILNQPPFGTPSLFYPPSPATNVFLKDFEFLIPANSSSPVSAHCYLCGGIDNIHSKVIRAGIVEARPLDASSTLPRCVAGYDGTQCNQAVLRNTTVIAQEKILLKPGTFIQSGGTAVSRLYIDPCLVVEEGLLEAEEEQKVKVQEVISRTPEEIDTTLVEASTNAENALTLYPNPFTQTVTIDYYIQTKNTALVSLTLYSPTGQKIETLIHQDSYTSGSYQLSYNGHSLAPGIYFYELKVDAERVMKKAVKVKF